MEVLKCKMCGGELELTENASICKCKYCGSMQTLPRERSDIRVNAYNRAGRLFMNGDFDKALALYEKILLEDPEDANAYWSCILCKYGVTYVEDPKTKERKITVNRTQNTAVVADDTYKQAIKYATAEQRELFEKEASEIDEIQKGILAISQNEEPFDVFISYKETDQRGERTMDSVLATDLYYGLTEAGYKVFLSRITLEDKLGSEYEPYIYAALNSAKVMIVLGTKAEYFNAPWVKNEWSRYLKIIKGDRHKMLIPAYRDMDAYDLPSEFALLQSQDMSKIGFLQDIIRGVKKVIGKDNKPVEKVIEKTVVKEVVSAGQQSAVDIELANLKQRIQIFINSKDWESASQYIERALDKAPVDAQLHSLKAQVSHKLDNEDALVNSGLEEDVNLNNAIDFATGEYKAKLEGIRDKMVANTKAAQKKYDENLARIRRMFDVENEIKVATEKVKDCAYRVEETEKKVVKEYNDANNDYAVLKKALTMIQVAIVSLLVLGGGIALMVLGVAKGAMSGVCIVAMVIAAVLMLGLELAAKYYYCVKYQKGTIIDLLKTLGIEYVTISLYAFVVDVKVFMDYRFEKSQKNINTRYYESLKAGTLNIYEKLKQDLADAQKELDNLTAELQALRSYDN